MSSIKFAGASVATLRTSSTRSVTVRAPSRIPQIVHPMGLSRWYCPESRWSNTPPSSALNSRYTTRGPLATFACAEITIAPYSRPFKLSGEFSLSTLQEI